MSDLNRRDFIKTTATMAAGVSVLGAPAFAQSSASANDRIRVVVVGVRGRGPSHINCLRKLASANIEIAGFCDCDQSTLDARLAEYEKKSGQRIKGYKDYREVLDDKSVDVVTLATPNHWHSLGAIWACQAGKDVYVEKPGSHHIHEGRKMVEAARKYNRIVQHGTQCRSSENIREGIQKLHEGLIGEVYMARGLAYKRRRGIGVMKPGPAPEGMDWDAWLGPGPVRPYADQIRNGYNNLWDFGNGEIGNQGVHQLDIIRWGMKLTTHPNRISSMGGVYTLPKEDAEEIPNTQTAAFQFPDRNVMVTFEVRHGITNEEAGMRDIYPFVDGVNVVGVIFLGSEGFMVFPDFSSYHSFLGDDRKPGPSKREEGQPMMDCPHFDNFFQAVRSRKNTDLHAEIEEGHMSAAICHLANISYRTGRTLQFDPKTEKFVNDPEADKLLTREPREPYAVPEEV